MRKKINIGVEEEFKEQLNHYCSENETTISQLIRKLLKEYLKNEKK